MSVELVNRITIKKDGVYINTHSNNDTAPFHSVKLKHISDAFNANGAAEWRKKQALKEFVQMFSRYGSVRLVEPRNGEHESITELRSALELHYLYRDRKREKANDEIIDQLKKSTHYTDSEKDTLEYELEKALDNILIDRSAEHYLKNGGGARWGIAEFD